MRAVVKFCLYGVGVFLSLTFASIMLLSIQNSIPEVESRSPIVESPPQPDPEPEPVVTRFVKYEVIDPKRSGQSAEWNFWVYYSDENGAQQRAKHHVFSDYRKGISPWTYSFVALGGDKLTLGAENNMRMFDPVTVRIYVDGALVVESTRPSPSVYWEVV